MGICRLRLIALPLAVVALAVAPAATAGRDAGLAALQVALQSRGLYAGAIDGVKGPGTTAAIKRFQRRAGLTPDGIPGTATRKALGRYGKHVLGSRPLTRGAAGWDVAALQFLLAWHGFPSATIDGGLGQHTELALRHFQRWAGLEPDGVAGATTYAALRRAPASCPISLAWPVAGPIGDPFGPRGNRFHAGVDILAAARHAGRGRRRRPRHLGGLARRRLGKPGRRRPCRRRADDVRAPLLDRRQARPARRHRRPAGHGRRDRRRHRAAPALRGPAPRRGGRPATGLAVTDPPALSATLGSWPRSAT